MQIFISFDYSDLWFAEQLTAALQENNYEPLVLNLKTQYSDKIFERAGRALRGCDHAIVILSKAYTESEWFEKELVALFMMEMQKDHPKPNFILPVLLEDCKIPGYINSRPYADFRDRRRDNNNRLTEEELKRITSLIEQKARQAFVIMKFPGKEESERELDALLENAYDKGIEPVLREYGYEVIKVDKIPESKKITDQMLVNLENSEVVIADLTGERPNCYYEAGYAHALGKDMVLTINKGHPIHFDVADYRFIEWADHNHLANELRKFLKHIQDKRSKT